MHNAMTGFSKNEDCPNSNELLAFQNGDTPRTRSREIMGHLRNCEFCAAEVEFYSHFPQAEGPVEPAEIPEPLFELAEALLKNRHTDAGSLNDLLSETDKVPVLK